MSWHYLIASVVASLLMAVLRRLLYERVEASCLQVTGWFMLCLIVCLLSSGLRRVSDKGHVAVTRGREWQTLWYLCKWAKVEAVTVGGSAAIPGVLQGTAHYLPWWYQQSCRVHCLGCTCVLWTSRQGATLKKTSPQSTFLEQKDLWLLLIIGQTARSDI